MSDASINGLNPVDSTIEQKLQRVEELRQSPIQALADAAKHWHETAQTLLASGAITPDMGVSEACLANQTTIGAVEARLSKAQMNVAA